MGREPRTVQVNGTGKMHAVKRLREEETALSGDESRGDDAVPTNPFKKVNIIPANIRIGEWPTKLIA